MEELESEAFYLSSLFGRTRNEAKNAVAAANGYKEMLEHLKRARNMTSQASLDAEEVKKFRKDGVVIA